MLTTIHASEFVTLLKQSGGDLWNRGTLIRRCCAIVPLGEISRIEFTSSGTGLWQDVIIVRMDGSFVERRVFG